MTRVMLFLIDQDKLNFWQGVFLSLCQQRLSGMEYFIFCVKVEIRGCYTLYQDTSGV